jgi:hypothetical protein
MNIDDLAHIVLITFYLAAVIWSLAEDIIHSFLLFLALPHRQNNALVGMQISCMEIARSQIKDQRYILNTGHCEI